MKLLPGSASEKVQKISVSSAIVSYIFLNEANFSYKGGFTRIVPLGSRLGDKAPMAAIEYIDQGLKYPEVSSKTNT